ncbi:glucose-6-phosphate exchanger SLC37A2-like [Clavelina lepadiformis]|uniref:Sugar phosphate exchanger 3 n=1 Tax=Clavelina lepadiformis TaxID=159417 RepID=A0ABP0GT25_CLALP
MASIPLFIRLLQRCGCCQKDKHNVTGYRYGMLVLTFFCYMSYHIARKPFSIVKSELHRNCSAALLNTEWMHYHISLLHLPINFSGSGNSSQNSSTWCDFPPFDKKDFQSLFGDLDYAFLFTYAIGMFISGMIAERMSLRYFLSIGMIFTGLFTSMFGMGYYFNIHVLSFYIFSQILNGAFSTTGWPAVVACMGNWFGKEKRGLIMGVWNSHTSFGNIFGSLIASAFVSYNWGLSFIVPGCIIGGIGVITFFTLIDSPEDVTGEASYHFLSNEDEESSEGSMVNTNSDDNIRQQYNTVEDISNANISSGTKPYVTTEENKPIGFIGALKIPGVIEFALCLLFAKLVSYTFLFWLPFYIKKTSTFTTQASGIISTLFDVGGIFGGITAGVVSDHTGGRATTCGVMLLIGAGMMYVFNACGSSSLALFIVLLLITGAFVNGPYALITTAVSADLGTHPVLKGNAKALSTVTAIIDGTGSIGAAIGPFLTGLISPSGWQNVFWMLIAANIAATLLLSRLMIKEINCWRVNGVGTSDYFRIPESSSSSRLDNSEHEA